MKIEAEMIVCFHDGSWKQVKDSFPYKGRAPKALALQWNKKVLEKEFENRLADKLGDEWSEVKKVVFELIY